MTICARLPESGHLALVKKDPARFFLPAYIGARGYVGMRVDGKRVDWKDVAERVTASWRSVAPKRLVASE